ncbi:allophanate hydrolase [Acidisoma cellulosilytica]|uniref:Allophanate hydrolase n=1 Tax=Acidisoma cellulosilyticum TaxID=2802395 RepID=A0A963Z2X2_9PROT|nr:allophanate hydrolase [Acidisoma cellulosilyticum]MCB8880977.1 allophanate hydrolase [Acidisoma cellulosilyticum]
MSEFSFDIASLRAAYLSGSLTPAQVMAEVLRRIAAIDDPAIWISRPADKVLMAEAEALTARADEIAKLPLYGIPFSVKDNIDVAGQPTTAACPAFEYHPSASATVVAKLVAAGAIVIGKTNLDQFATGLVGVRSPYGIPRNSFDPKMVPGGSSSGSAVSVAGGLVSFALGTDTAGSGRVPAAFNNLVGVKPTRGLISNSGMVPACRSIDCVSIFALTVPDALAVLDVAGGFDATDAYSVAAPAGFSATLRAAPGTFTFAVPHQAELEFFGDEAARALFAEAVARAEALGGTRMEIDFAPWVETANLLYGPWTAERTAAVGPLLAVEPDVLHPVTRQIVEVGLKPTAVEIFQAQYRLQELRQVIAPLWQTADFLLVPTTGTAFSLADLEAAPVARNTDLGYYTNFTNLLDLSAIAVPSGFKPNGFPAGVTLIGPAWHDAKLAAVAHSLHRAMCGTMGATGFPQPETTAVPAVISQPEIEIAVFGAHLTGQPLNPQLRGFGGKFQRTCRTADRYRMVAIPGRILRPGLIDIGDAGQVIEGEIWSLPSASLAAFLATITPPLGLGTVRLAEGQSSLGFICEGGVLTDGAADVSAFGHWPAYLQSLAT